MIIIGCDYHPGFQQIAFVDTETGDCGEQCLEHCEGAEKFYRDLAAQGKKVRVGMEASGHARWFERLLGELNIELWVGDAAVIRAKRGRKAKTDRQDALHILNLLLKDDFPKIWVPSWENRDMRQLLWHRHRMVQTRTRIMNQLQAVALNEGLRCKKKLWREHGREQLENVRLAPWTSRRREDLLQLLDGLNPTIAELTQAIEREAEKSRQARLLMTHPGVGPLTALAFVLIIGKAERFQCGKQISAYLGLVPLEDSSGERRRLGHITKQGNSLLRFLLVEAAQATTRTIPEWRSKHIHLTMRRGRKIAKVAMARKLAIRLFWMMRQGWNYQQVMKFGSQGRKPLLSCCRDQGFDSIAKVPKFADHSISAMSSCLCTHRGTSLFVTHTAMENDPDEAAKPMGNGPDGLIVSQARYQSAIDDLENGSFRLGCGVGSLIENAPHVAIALRGTVTLGYFCTFFLARACSNP